MADRNKKTDTDSRNERIRRICFFGMIAVSFFAILIYNILTPAMSDDLTYHKIVSQANSFLELVRQEQHQYMTWTGRSVNHMILRCFLSGDKWIFNICNSMAFVVLTLFMYYLIENKKKYDIFVYLLINLFVWTFSVSFAQTVLWETGACNYLWGSTIILAYLSVFRFCRDRDYMGTAQIAPAVGLFLLGILAGWCNENTSGGCILLTLIWIAFYVYEKKRVRLWMAVGVAGNMTGFLFMVLAPGNASRMTFMEEEHTGIVAILSRWLKCCLAIKNHFFVLLALCIIAFVLVRLQKAQLKHSRNMLVFLFVFAATCYALVLTPEPVARAYFGAGVFLMISCIQGIVDVADRDLYVRTLKLSAAGIFALYFAFTWLESGADLMRIYREYNERYAYIEEQKAAGEKDITVPLLRPDFQTKYSDAYNSDFAESSAYWINITVAQYYDLDSISAVPREEWKEY